MKQLITSQEVSKITNLPPTVTNGNNVDSAIILSQDTDLMAVIPNKMYLDLIGDMVDRPELTAYLFISEQVKFTNSGVRVVTEQYSDDANDRLLARVQANNTKIVLAYKKKLIDRYEAVNYRFDDIDYPPEINMADYYLNGRFFNNGRIGYYDEFGKFSWSSEKPAGGYHNGRISIWGV
jgi:hypothetical protein